jgi:hypothetical protein
MAALDMPGIKNLPKSTPRDVRSEMETLLLTISGIACWKKPPFQRDFRLTDKVKAISDQIKKDRGIIPGVVTLGKLDGETYLVDGQHRIEAFKMTDLVEGIADVRIKYFNDMAEMAQEFIGINTALVRMRNDDFLRSLEQSNEHLLAIRRKCPFIGYNRVRVGNHARVLMSMAQVLRTWDGSDGDTPSHGESTMECASALNAFTVKAVCDFMNACFEAWGNDEEHYRLWSSLNLSLLMWLWRRVVMGEHLTKTKRWTKLDRDQFVKCLMALAANPVYTEFLRGRNLSDRDRPPTYTRIKQIFTHRLAEMALKQVRFPQEEWVKG